MVYIDDDQESWRFLTSDWPRPCHPQHYSRQNDRRLAQLAFKLRLVHSTCIFKGSLQPECPGCQSLGLELRRRKLRSFAISGALGLRASICLGLGSALLVFSGWKSSGPYNKDLYHDQLVIQEIGVQRWDVQTSLFVHYGCLAGV